MAHSDTIGALAAALAKAQGAMVAAKKDAKNPFFKSDYATLASVWEVARGPLSANDLAIVQTTRAAIDPATILLETTLIHSSGEWVSSDLLLNPKDGSPQALGSALTYGRRYALAAIVGIVADEDDDGNAANNGHDKQQSTRKPTHETVGERVLRTGEPPSSDAEAEFNAIPGVNDAPVMATEAQIRMMGILVKEMYPKPEDMASFRAWLVNTYNVDSRKALTKAQASAVIDTLTKMKNGEPV